MKLRITGLLLVAGMLLAACGNDATSSADEQSSETAAADTTSAAPSDDVVIDIGTGDISVEAGPPRIAFFVAGTSNSFLQANISGAEEQAEAIGAELTVFDGMFDPLEQLNQMETALASDSFDAWIVMANDGNLLCDIASQDAPDAGIVVSVVLLPICDRASNLGADTYQPGTLNFIGGNETPDAFREVFRIAIEQNSGPQKVGVLTGPDLNTNTINIELVLAELAESNPEFEVVATARTDYSVPTSQAEAENMIAANPDLTVVFGAYSNITKGAVAALENADLLDSVAVYDTGGTTWAVEALAEGQIQVTTGLYAKTMLVAAVAELDKAFSGQPTENFVDNMGHALEPGRDPADPGPVFIVTPDNIDDFEPESD